MENYIYIYSNQATVKIYYTRAKTKQKALIKLTRMAKTPVHLYHIVAENMQKLQHETMIYEYDYPDYEG